MNQFLKSSLAWWVLFLAALCPFFAMLYRIFVGMDLGPDPAQTLVEYFAIVALIMLWVTLAVSPIKYWLGWNQLLRFRRMLGLYALFYAVLHVLSYWIFLADLGDILNDLLKRKYISVGFIAFVILIVLGLTSPKKAVRKLGRKWKSIHQFVYLAAVLVTVHFAWQIRSDYTEVAVYAAILALLFLLRSSKVKALKPAIKT